MRLSIDSDDRGNSYYEMLMANDKHVRVFLDGVEQDCVITCDDELGFIDRYRKDANGDFILDRLHECAARETVQGAVRIEITDAPYSPLPMPRGGES